MVESLEFSVGECSPATVSPPGLLDLVDGRISEVNSLVFQEGYHINSGSWFAFGALTFVGQSPVTWS